MTYKKIKNLFLRESYLDAWEDYERSLRKENFLKWDHVILTASNEAQAEVYRGQIARRLELGLLPASTSYAVLPDPDGKRVGSGGATFHVLRHLAEQEGGFRHKRILVIHSGGDSRRVPQYSALGKLFSPVPRELPNGYASTLFDEFMIVMSGVPSRIGEGMLVLSGDVLLLFNPLQIDLQYRGAAAISIKEPVATGQNHGVFLNDGSGNVEAFLHKQPEAVLRSRGAVNAQGNVDLDTGAVIFDSELLDALYSLISTGGRIDEEKYREFVNEEARISFYGDFLYPLAKSSTLEQYLKEAAEGSLNDALCSCRRKLWDVLSGFSMKLICPSPAEFLHFGTTAELRELVTRDIGDYEFLDWSPHVLTNAGGDFAANNAYVGRRAQIGKGAYLESAYVLEDSRVGSGAIVSYVKLRNRAVPADTVLHGLPLSDGSFTVRVYAVGDNPKAQGTDAPFLATTLRRLLECSGLTEAELWAAGEEKLLWNARLYPVCASQEEALDGAEILLRMAKGKASEEESLRWKQSRRESLSSSFALADVREICRRGQELEQRVLSRKMIDCLAVGCGDREALEVFGVRGITEQTCDTLLEDAAEAEFSLKIRIYYALSRFMKAHHIRFHGKDYDWAEKLCFDAVREAVRTEAEKKLPRESGRRICRDQVRVELPVRVNWGGGWTDTPPYCIEHGGTVLNAALKLGGKYPVLVELRRLEKLHIEFESADVGVFGTAETLEEIRDCRNPFDPFALHKAALISAGVIPAEGEADLKELLQRLGGGIYLSTQVLGIPKGSGLGTSSILAAACIRGIFEFFGKPCENSDIYTIVLSMEQMMSTGGGWQDQAGGLTEGIKLITSEPGFEQKLRIEPVILSAETKKELQERFALIYTGQRRLARNLLRKVVGGYIGGRPESVAALRDMKPLTLSMKDALERGDLDGFAMLLDRHWQLSQQLDQAATNTCIDQIFLACEDLICGRFICGAGGGGFLQVILKKGVTREMLDRRLTEVFQQSGVAVWESEFV